MGKKYAVRIEEILGRTVTVEAESPDEAEAIVQKMYDDSEIILSADDFCGVEIYEESEEVDDAEG